MSKIANMLDADLKGKVCLVRMDHNVVKNGIIKDTMRIDATIPTLLHIYKKGGLPVLMTHIGRPFDKKTGSINISEGDSVLPIVQYLENKFQLQGLIPDCKAESKIGITDLAPIGIAIEALKKGAADFVYLPNTRWFKGEEAKDESADIFAQSLANYADVYINDAFGSWQAHSSTYNIAKFLPSYAGLLMQKEIANLNKVFEPQRPFLAIVAGAKFDTKIGPLSSLIKIADKLILGGVIYNAYLCSKYKIQIEGVTKEDIEFANKFIIDSKDYLDKIVELPIIVENEGIEKRQGTKELEVQTLKPGTKLNYVLDASAENFTREEIKKVFQEAGTIFVNAVMGYTALYPEGSMAMYSLIDQCPKAIKLFGGGDTIQDFKEYLPGIFAKAQNDPSYYFFTGGGAILDAIQQGSPYGMKPVQMLIQE
ncbi:MAG TPA: phosphoglycerate kinase [Candidatus Cloacimonas sp.]|nr:phosphoglycerate kinase [Candidatus Cloacimonas acidaminovorans]HQI53197.1 phosphoglycerate kinase [Candidatus Cloacimonas acidaminovorans]HQJ17850.1 phosphoglycerate kinase [Candidatus Cloacimonas acidaminovorans]HRU83145.1 phosphoglycerate kinase [Candidatus Cloacimonas sp.]